jgi:hypothetical protein
LKAAEDDGDIVYIAPNIGEVKKEYSNQSGWELKEILNPRSRSTIVPLSD